MNAVFDNLDLYWQGLVGTVSITVASFALAFVLGVSIAAFRVSPVPPLRWAGTTWVQVFRNTPLTVLLFLFFFGFTKIGISYSPFVSAVLVCAAYTSAFVAETIRSGFNTVAPGQAEAARAIGLTFPQVLWLIVGPQALRNVVSPMGSVFSALIRNSSIAFTIAAVELVGITDTIGNRTAQWPVLFVGTACAYLAMTLPTGAAVNAIERRVSIHR